MTLSRVLGLYEEGVTPSRVLRLYQEQFSHLAFPLAGLSGGWDAEPSAQHRTSLPAPYTQGGGWERWPSLAGAVLCVQPI